MKSSKCDPKSDRIDMRLHEVQRVHYDHRADSAMQIALSPSVDGKTAARYERKAREIYSTARAVIRGAGDINVRQQVINVLRRIGR